MARIENADTFGEEIAETGGIRRESITEFDQAVAGRYKKPTCDTERCMKSLRGRGFATVLLMPAFASAEAQ